MWPEEGMACFQCRVKYCLRADHPDKPRYYEYMLLMKCTCRRPCGLPRMLFEDRGRSVGPGRHVRRLASLQSSMATLHVGLSPCTHAFLIIPAAHAFAETVFKRVHTCCVSSAVHSSCSAPHIRSGGGGPPQGVHHPLPCRAKGSPCAGHHCPKFTSNSHCLARW